MTNSNSNLTTQQVEFILDNLTYTLTTEKYKQLEKFSDLYDSIMHLLNALSFDESSNAELSHVVSILDHFNNTFFEFIETIQANPIQLNHH